MKIRFLFVAFFLPFLFSGCFKTKAEIAKEREELETRSALQQNLADNSQGLDKIEREIGQLQGRLDEVEHQRKKDVSSINTSRESEKKNLEKSVDELRTRLNGLQDAQNALFEEIKMLKEERLQAEKLGSHGKRPLPAGKIAKNGLGTYDTAMVFFKNKDFQKAADGFRTYIENNPKGKHLIDAQYFLGESLFAEEDFAQAVVAFGVVHEKSSSTAIGRKSTLKIAQSFKAMGKDKDAKAFAQLLVQADPKSEEAKKARKLLK